MISNSSVNKECREILECIIKKHPFLNPKSLEFEWYEAEEAMQVCKMLISRIKNSVVLREALKVDGLSPRRTK